MFQLHPEQQYVQRQAQALGLEIKKVHHPIATTTCYEKAKLLQETHPDQEWTPERVVKALYGMICWDNYGFVLPELGRRLDLEMIRSTFQEAGLEPPSSARECDFHPSKVPPSMERGTCSPFPTEEEMRFIGRIFFYDFPDLENRIVDISMGGKGEEAHKVSWHLPYKGIHDILKEQFNGKIYKVRIPFR